MSKKTFRNEIKESFAAWSEPLADVQTLRDKLVVRQRELTAARLQDRKVRAERELLGDAIDGCTKLIAGFGIARSVSRNIERADRDAKVSPAEKGRLIAATYHKVGAEIEAGRQRRERERLGLTIEPDAAKELQNA